MVAISIGNVSWLCHMWCRDPCPRGGRVNMQDESAGELHTNDGGQLNAVVSHNTHSGSSTESGGGLKRTQEGMHKGGSRAWHWRLGGEWVNWGKGTELTSLTHDCTSCFCSVAKSNHWLLQPELSNKCAWVRTHSNTNKQIYTHTRTYREIKRKKKSTVSGMWVGISKYYSYAQHFLSWMPNTNRLLNPKFKLVFFTVC